MGRAVVLEFEREVEASRAVVWRALSNTDAFNRVARLGFRFETAVDEEGAVRMTGSVRRFAQTLTWDERPFRFVGPDRFVSERLFRSGPVASVVTSFRLANAPVGTAVRYRIELEPRSVLLRPLIVADAHLNTRPVIDRALDTVLAAVEEDTPLFDTPPALDTAGAERLETGLEAVEDLDVRRALKHIATRAPLSVQTCIQPARLARQLGLELEPVLDACLSAVDGGAFELRYLLLCPLCLGPKESIADLDFRTCTVHCDTCGISYDGGLADNLEVALRPHPDVRDDPVVVDCLQSPARTPHVVAQECVGIGETLELELALEPGCYRVEAAPYRGAMLLEVLEEGESFVVADAGPFGMVPRRAVVGAGTVAVTVRSRAERELVWSVARTDRPVFTLTLGRFLDTGVGRAWASRSASVTRTVADGVVVVLRVETPWGRRTEDLGKLLRWLDAEAVQVANGVAVGIFPSERDAALALPRVARPQVSVALARGPVARLEGPFGAAVVGPIVDRALAALRRVGWGRVALCEGVDVLEIATRCEGEVVRATGIRPTLLKLPAPTPELPAELGEGTRMGRYALGGLLGGGAMGNVFEATDLTDAREVVVKVMRPECLRDHRYTAAFYREARLGWAIRHPQAVRVLDWGAEGAAALYLVMERLDGVTLLQTVKASGPLRGDALVGLACDLLDGLAAIHDAGVVHRDLKPSNVMMTSRGAVLVDFGIALPMDALNADIAGTVAYMSPEQRRGEPLDGRSDLYQLAILLVRMGTGRWPFSGADAEARHAWREAHAVDTLPEGLPEVLEQPLIRALSYRRVDRYDSARAMRAAIVG